MCENCSSAYCSAQQDFHWCGCMKSHSRREQILNMEDFHNFQGFVFDFEGFVLDFEGFKSVFKPVSYKEAFEEFEVNDPLFELEEENEPLFSNEYVYVTDPYEGYQHDVVAGEEMHDDPLSLKEKISADMERSPMKDRNFQSISDVYLSSKILQRVNQSDKLRMPDRLTPARHCRSKTTNKKDQERRIFSSNNGVLFKKLAESPFPVVVLRKLPVGIIGKRLRLSKLGCESLKQSESSVHSQKSRRTSPSTKRSLRKSMKKKTDCLITFSERRYTNNFQHCKKTDISTQRNLMTASRYSFKPRVLRYNNNTRSTETISTDSHCSPSIRCLYCNFSTICEKTLKKHMNTHRLKCSSCDFKTNWKRGMEAHLLTHSDQKIFHCFECDYSTRIKICIRSHLSVHFEFKSLKCFKCEYECETKDELKVHSQMHRL